MTHQGLFQTQTLTTRQELQLQLTPQQIVALEILAMPLQDLQARILHELETNPVLESREIRTEEVTPILSGESMSTPQYETKELMHAVEKDDFLASIFPLSNTWDDYLPDIPSYGTYTEEDEERRRYFFNSLKVEKTLYDDLLEQLQLCDIPDSLEPIAREIIGNLDERGYFVDSFTELQSLQHIQDPKKREELGLQALQWVQKLDPPGIGARNLKECLLIQLERMGKKNTLVWKIVHSHLEEIAKNQIPQIAKKLNVSPQEIYLAIQEIQKLQPRPGSVYGGTSASEYVEPEVFVEKVDGEYVVRPNHESQPKLLVARKYLNLLENPDVPPAVKSYIREKIQSGKFLIKSIGQRQQTLQKIAEIIVRKQKDFFEIGDEGLKPMTMQEIAKELGFHETTVSRAIARKYMMTPRGLIPFRHFFSSGYVNESGEAVSQKGIKMKIQTIIANEDPMNPISDQEIAEMLRKEGYNVARRTIAKYREELGIPSTRLRRKHL